MNNRLASATDLAADEHFVQWVKAPSAESNGLWESWLEKNPSRVEEVRQARELVMLLSEDTHEVCESDVDHVWQALKQRTEKEEAEEAGETRVVPISRWQLKRKLIAASAVLLLVSGIMLLSLSNLNTVEYATGYGEKRNVVLPDNSKVVLNANSSVSYTNGWFGVTPRVVRLSGEAYFAVTHKDTGQRFIVQTPDGTEVEVLGTEFNVKSRGEGNQVVLASGQVRLSYVQAGEHQQVKMQPGELVELSGETGLVTKERVRTELYTSWKDNKIIFNDTSLQEIAIMLEDLYGYQVVIEDPDLAAQELTASLTEKGVENILAIVSGTLGVKITRQDSINTILISNLN